MKSIAVIGSGLSAIGAIKRLIEEGFKPTVLDSGVVTPSSINELKDSLRNKDVDTWSSCERAKFAEINQYHSAQGLPKKTYLGSEYFYGTSVPQAVIESVGPVPPFSYAKGGLSIGWGAAVLPPKNSDIKDWPINYNELIESIAKVLKDMPLAAKSDELEEEFPLLCTNLTPIKTSLSTRELLARLRNKLHTRPNRFTYGEARLLLQVNNESENACKYCGECMSGCVFDSIYKSSSSIEEWAKQGLIEYKSGLIVQKVVENKGLAQVKATTQNGSLWKGSFDHVFLAAGAVNSFRIIAQSSKLGVYQSAALTRGGYVVPVLTLKGLKNEWPKVNTMPSLFIETKPSRESSWVHIQLSLHNELFSRKIRNLLSLAKINYQWLLKLITSHVFIGFVNLHSEYAGQYKLSLVNSEKTFQRDKLITGYSKSNMSVRQKALLWVEILRVFLSIGCIPLIMFARKNKSSYHVAGTLPMRNYSDKPLTTDPDGKPYGFQHINVVDTATYPSLPGTTIGLIAMGNAYRIVKNTSLKVQH